MAVLAVVQVDSLKHRCDDLIRPIGWTDRERGDTSFERMDTARFSPYHVGRSLILRRVGDPHMEASGEPDQLVPEGRIDHYRDAVGGLFPSHFRVHRASLTLIPLAGDSSSHGPRRDALSYLLTPSAQRI